MNEHNWWPTAIWFHISPIHKCRAMLSRSDLIKQWLLELIWQPEEIDAELQSPWNTNAGDRNTIYSSQAAQLQCNFEPLSYNDASQIAHNFINFPQSRDCLLSSNFWVFHLLKTNNFLKSSVGRSTITSNIWSQLQHRLVNFMDAARGKNFVTIRKTVYRIKRQLIIISQNRKPLIYLKNLLWPREEVIIYWKVDIKE